MPGEYLANRLQSLIEDNEVRQIQIYRFSDSKFHHQSEVWRFGQEYIEVGGQPYNLNRVVTFLLVDHTLCLYF